MLQRYLLAPFLIAALLPATAQIPTLLRDINPGGDAVVRYITCANGSVYFSANDGVHGAEPWVSDGTTSGTFMLKDINPGSGSSSPVSFLEWNDRVYFAAANGVDGYQLWGSDGTTANTLMELAVDDVNGLTGASDYTVYGNKIVFSGQNDESGKELWISDGTVGGTVLLKDINPGVNSSNPKEFTVYNGLLYFVASTPASGKELWVTDGTEAGTVLVKDIWAGTNSSVPADLVVANGLLFFKASGGYASGDEPWASDGTAVGTYMVKDIVPGGNGSAAQGFVNFNGEAWFIAYDGPQAQLWHSDGTATGTYKLPEPATPYDLPGLLSVHNGKLYFGAFETNASHQIWVSDGTPAGTAPIYLPGSPAFQPLASTTVITGCGDYLFYPAVYDAAIGLEPYTLLLPVGIAEQQAKGRDRLYPNPATERLFMSDAPARAKLQLYAANGALALQADVQDMDISTLPAGLYLARITAQDGTLLHVQQVVKQP